MRGVESARTTELRFRRAVPGAVPDGDAWLLRWEGVAVMGVVNVTPDSFSEGGPLPGPEGALARARALRAAGALVLDVGGESTRPGAEPVPASEELRRVLPVIEGLAAEGEAVISVDTSKPEVAREALAAGAHLVNDVTALRDEAMRAVCAEAGAAAVVMHMQGEPRTMQQVPRYGDVVAEVGALLRERAEDALAAGVPDVMIDPGIGFGKEPRHNLALIRGLHRLGPHPVLLGASRKRFLGALAGVPEAGPGRDAASIAAHLFGAFKGAAMIRVHDVAGHAQALRVWRELWKETREEMRG